MELLRQTNDKDDKSKQFANNANILILSRRQSHANNNTSLFLASLSVADLLFLLLYLPLDIWRQVDSSVYQVTTEQRDSSTRKIKFRLNNCLIPDCPCL